MKAFIKRIVLFALVVILLFAGIWMLIPIPEENYFLASVKDKEARLHDIKEPKIIIIGGSNGIFGVHSAMLENAFNMPIVNMSLHGSMNYDFMVDQITPYINKGDIVLALQEYNHYVVPHKRSAIVIRILETYPQAVYNFPLKKRPKYIATALLQTTRSRLLHVIENGFAAAEVPPAYQRDNVNEYGDLIGHWNLPRKDKLKGVKFELGKRKISSTFYSITNGLMNKAKTVGAKCFITYPSIAASRCDTASVYHIHEALLQKKYPVLGEPNDFIYNDTLFFDTRYHLTKDAGVQRTQQIIDLLKDALN